MTTLQKSLLAIAGVVVLAAIYGAYQYPQATLTASATPTGGTTSTAHFYSVAVNLAAPGVNATSSSVFNPSANDYYVSSIKAGCESVGTSQTAYTGAGLASLTVYAATTSTAAPAIMTNTNKVGGGNVTIGTSTPNFAISTSTIGGTVGSNNVYIIWPAGTYMTFTTNATNTALCTFGVEAFSS